ncbi:SIR2 family NAD-dependent protein deacylase [Kyrpidia spormannii]|uniref:Iron dicitrate transport regulator FecR n=1 Tax=Kyrpidia spormannii TaxID=2055160 RepID=A0ACA8Z8J0_9BACL|nr:Sir2 family NAD-dependent protein deacetylase [Kyrpidia spormannii]CAB3391916.1 Iron dicitrate transport regulator FecR [Kyrpidia spormannii]
MAVGERVAKEDRQDLEFWGRLWQSARRPLVLSGAGISVASGLPTVGHRWNGIPLRTLFTRRRFENRPKEFFDCYRDWLWNWGRAEPNPAHRALAAWGGRVVTLNVDGLHRKAGSSGCVEVHGRLFELACRQCGLILEARLAFREDVPRCPGCNSLLAPNMVFVGEPVRHFATVMDWVGDADLLVAIGTRLDVSPINQIPLAAHRKGIPLVRINRRAEVLVPILVGRA